MPMGRSNYTMTIPADAKLTFANLKYSELRGFLGTDPMVNPNFDALVEGDASVTGPALQPKNLRGDLQLSRVELFTTQPQKMALKNEGPIVAHLERSVVKIEKARLTGPQTDINVNGSLALDTQSPLNFRWMRKPISRY